MVELCISRAVAGIGGGGMNAVVSILMSDIVPLRERGVWQGYINIIFAAGTSTGAPMGGLLADTIGWRWYVYLTLHILNPQLSSMTSTSRIDS